jgi:hypothetical protein
MRDPDAGWSSCAVVVDGDRVVSTATLLDETLHIGGVDIPAGQVELVATDRGYEARGLVRELIGWAHERSVRLGQALFPPVRSDVMTFYVPLRCRCYVP